MKLLSVTCTLLFVSTIATGQVQLGLFAGAQATSSKYVVQGKRQDNTFKYGIQGGAMLKVPFENRLFFVPAAYYSMKGYDVKFTQFAFPPDVNAADNNTTIHCFELAALLQLDLGNKPSHFYIKAGPSLDFQLFGKETFNLRTGGAVSRKMKWGPGDYGRYSASFHAQLGYETSSGFLIFLQYTHGAASINNADYGPRIRHRAFGLSFGKYLKKKKIIIDTRNRE
ncbi:MAG: porin family protein [Chitinophagaceae bacterium]